jgi:hypothetical protein
MAALRVALPLVAPELSKDIARSLALMWGQADPVRAAYFLNASLGLTPRAQLLDLAQEGEVRDQHLVEQFLGSQNDPASELAAFADRLEELLPASYTVATLVHTRSCLAVQTAPQALSSDGSHLLACRLRNPAFHDAAVVVRKHRLAQTEGKEEQENVFEEVRSELAEIISASDGSVFALLASLTSGQA